MKSILFIILVALIPNFIIAQSTPEEAVFLGDNFSLEGAIELFKNSSTLEEFEQKLNSDDQDVNNLDLDEDGNVDYIRVLDNVSEDAHAIILQVDLKDDESQDICVIEIEKDGEESALLQIIGNEDVFGEEVIAEPFSEETSGTEGRGPNGEAYYTARLIVNVWSYRCVRHIYAPNYVVWVSPFRFGYYPNIWKPRKRLAWSVWHPRTLVWGRHYHRVKTHRVARAHKIYTPKRKTSVTVRRKTTVTRTNRKNGVSVTRKTKTKVKKADGGKVVGKKGKTKKGKKGN